MLYRCVCEWRVLGPYLLQLETVGLSHARDEVLYDASYISEALPQVRDLHSISFYFSSVRSAPIPFHINSQVRNNHNTSFCEIHPQPYQPTSTTTCFFEAINCPFPQSKPSKMPTPQTVLNPQNPLESRPRRYCSKDKRKHIKAWLFRVEEPPKLPRGAFPVFMPHQHGYIIYKPKSKPKPKKTPM